MINFISNGRDFIIKEVHKIIAAEGYRDVWIYRAVTLCQPGYSAEKKPGVVLIILY